MGYSCEHNIKMDSTERGYECVDRIHVAQDSPVVCVCVSCNESSASIKGREFLDEFSYC